MKIEGRPMYEQMCPFCKRRDISIMDRELLSQSQQMKLLLVSFYCNNCRVCFTEQFRNEKKEVLEWFVKKLEGSCCELPLRPKFNTSEIKVLWQQG